MRSISGVLPVLMLLSSLAPAPAAAMVIDLEGFESGLGGVTTSGTVTIETAAFGIAPLNGSTSQALLTTGGSATATATTESDLGLAAGTIDAIFTSDVDPFSTGTTVMEGAGLQLTFAADAGDVLEWDWAFVTNEVSPSTGNTPPNPGLYTDFAWFFLDYPTTTDAGGALTHANDATVTFSTSATSFLDEVAYSTIMLAVPETGTYTISVGVHDLQDPQFDTGLIIDAFRLVKGPEPNTAFLVYGGLAGLVWHSRRRRARVTPSTRPSA